MTLNESHVEDAALSWLAELDYAVRHASPLTAAGVVQGRSANGRVDWKTKDGKALKDLQEAAAKI